MSITLRLTLAFVLMVVFTTAVGVLGLMRMRDLNQTLDVITNDRFEKLDMARRGLELIEENARLAVLIFTGDPKSIDQQVAAQKARSEEISRLYEAFEERINSPDERQSFDTIKARRAVYVKRRSDLEASLASDRSHATIAFQAEVLPQLLAYIDAWNSLVDLEGRRVKDAVEVAEGEYARARITTIVFVAIAAVLGALVALFVTTRIARPLREVARAAQRLEKDGTTPKLPVRSSDEIGTLTRAFNMMSEAVIFRHERLAREMSLAQRIQTALLPRSVEVARLEVAASMAPATEVGGDYYEVLPTADGCWFGIGDVAGHGLESGLIMLMIQCSVMTMVRQSPSASPREIIHAVNRTLFENLQDRLRTTTFATLVLMRHGEEGRFVFAGAHEEIVVWRAATKACEIIPTPGTWVGGRKNIDAVTVESSIQLLEGDVMVLFTDGIIEARSADNKEFGVERVCKLVEDNASAPVEDIRAKLFAAVGSWQKTVMDDATAIVIRRPKLDG